MKIISIDSSKKYDVIIGRGLLEQCGSLIATYIAPCRAALMTDSNVDALYSERLQHSLAAAGFDVCKFVFPAGEKSKNINTYTDILNFLSENRITRSDIIIALGGGVTGDISGFAAATYMRGIQYIQIPTTFLAAVDSSVGGKTAIDLPFGKNLAGAFWPPSLVICDCDTFATLPEDVFADGIAESIKHGLIADVDFFHMLADGDISENIETVVCRNVEIKYSFVAEDEFEQGNRQMLNFGHTIGHAIEQLSEYQIPHGHAVSIGMVYALRASGKMGFCDGDILPKVIAALQKYNLPLKCDFTVGELYETAVGDKKRAGAFINIVSLDAIGQAKLVKLSLDDLRTFIVCALDE